MSKKEILDVWRNMPVYKLIIEELISKPQGLSVRELLAVLKKEHGVELNRNELHSALLKLEMNGLVYVEHIGNELVARLSPDFMKNICRS